jgi:hypothetical protein
MARIAPYFPLPHGVPEMDDRRVVSGIVYVIGDLPPNFHPAAIRTSADFAPYARVEQRAIGAVGRGCAADRPLR